VLMQLLGYGLVVLLWYLLTFGSEPIIKAGILPSPGDVYRAFGELLRENSLLSNMCYSIGLNLGGYIEAIALAIPLGFIIGLVIPIRLSAKGIVESLRYVSLPAVLGLFIAWFGIGSGMKIHFLAFGILIYLLPIVIQRIDEVNQVYVKTVYTIGANWWQTVRTVYLPSVLSRISDDIRVLTAISWTYIIISESIGGEGGLGGLIWKVGLRRGRLDKTFAILLLIILIGILQDRLLTSLDKRWFPHKYVTRRKPVLIQQGSESVQLIVGYMKSVVKWLFAGAFYLLLFNELIQFLPEKYLSSVFQDTVWVLWVLGLLVLGMMIYKFAFERKFPYIKAANGS